MIFNIHTTDEADQALDSLRRHSAMSRIKIAELPDDPLAALAMMKFDQMGLHPLEERPLNLIEQLNQTFTYLVAILAAKQLLEWHPEANGFRLAPGAHAPRGTLDIESLSPGIVGAETFAAVTPDNNRKLKNDLDKLALRTETHRYSFFMSPLFPKSERQFEKERDGIQVFSIAMPS